MKKITLEVEDNEAFDAETIADNMKNVLREAMAQKSVDDADTAVWILDKSPEDVCEERMSWSELCDMAHNLAYGFVTLRKAINVVLTATDTEE